MAATPFIARSALTALAFVLCALTSAASAQTAREPDAIVRWLYEATMKTQNRAVPSPFDQNNKKRQLLTQSLDTLWKRADKKVNPDGKDMGAIEFDVVSNSQDPSIKSFRLKTESRDEQRATVAADFTSIYGGPRRSEKRVLRQVARYDLLRENGAWKIDNVRLTIEGKPWEMRAFLEAVLRNCIGSDRPCDAPR
jgi:hypothetical protein